MIITDLPNEILLEIYRQGGLDLLASGLPVTCRKFWQLSFENQLWSDSLAHMFRQCYFSAERISAMGAIPTYRSWFYQQLRINRDIAQALDALVFGPGADAESWALKVTSYRLQAAIELEKTIAKPKTIAHFHWASWLLEAVFRLEGVYRLLELSTENDYGNALIANPLKHVEALLFLRLGRRPKAFLDAMTTDWSEVAGEGPKEEQIMRVVKGVQALAQRLGIKNDYYSTLLRSVVFVHVASEVWEDKDIKLFTFPGASFCCINNGESVVFVDFNRQGKLRTVEEVRDIMTYAQVVDGAMHFGISFYDIMATTYVWRTLPTENRKSILGLIEHAAIDVSIRKQKQYPNLYPNLVHRIINKNIADIELSPPVPLSRQPTGNALQSGMVCQVLGLGQVPEPVVVLEVFEHDCVVLRGSQVRSVESSRLIPGYDGKVKTEAGLMLPDIDVDKSVLGEYFITYDPRSQTFLPA